MAHVTKRMAHTQHPRALSSKGKHTGINGCLLGAETVEVRISSGRGIIRQEEQDGDHGGAGGSISRPRPSGIYSLCWYTETVCGSALMHHTPALRVCFAPVRLQCFSADVADMMICQRCDVMISIAPDDGCTQCLIGSSITAKTLFDCPGVLCRASNTTPWRCLRTCALP